LAEPFDHEGEAGEAPPIAGMSFEQAMAELEGIVQRQAQLRVDKLTLDAEGKPSTTPLDPPQ
jgi:exonuclease VII small subunit